MHDLNLPPDGYRQRRRNLLDRMEKNSVAVVPGGPAENGLRLFRQTNDFYYLCGVESPNAYLLVDRRDDTVTLFLTHQSELEQDRDGAVPSVESAEAVIASSGVDQVMGVEKLGSKLERTGVIYAPYREGAASMSSWDTHIAGRTGRFGDPWDGTLDRFAHFLELLRRRS